ncbi:hypothetical protein V4Q93_16375 [Legionella pneumophila]|nr:hypothetical protein LPE509_02200 [Legionella pneumophila subsp. pneumophila LPE509]
MAKRSRPYQSRQTLWLCDEENHSMDGAIKAQTLALDSLSGTVAKE